MPRRAHLLLICMVPGGALLPGCEADPYRPPPESILEVLQGPSLQQAADMAADPFDPDRRYRGTLLLAGMEVASEEVYLNLFREFTTDRDSAVRGAAARALANHGVAADALRLIPLLQDDDVFVRREAARGLQRLHHANAIEPLIARLNLSDATAPVEEDTQVRAEAALALGQYASPRVIDALVASLDDPQLAVNRSSLSALRTLTGQNLGYSRADWTLWLQEQRAPMQGQAVFIYPGYERPPRWFERIPFLPKPAVETPGIPRGYPLPGE